MKYGVLLCVLILAAAGVKVAKHGNRAASSLSGTADCLEALGVNILQSPKRCVELLGIAGKGMAVEVVENACLAREVPCVGAAGGFYGVEIVARLVAARQVDVAKRPEGAVGVIASKSQ